ncbi:MAG: hypothetical protein DRI80_18225 [Chloroflexota bacterium]|nr:MAG: hypothetical protein DRI80_18225 [Chloroflexota bacterium]
MARLTFTKDNLPTPEEFKRMLSEAMTQSNPVDDLLEVAGELWEYERKYNMTSAEFYEQFRRGMLDDELQHCIGWAAAFQTFTKLKRTVESTLMREAVWREVHTEPEVPA